MSSIAILRITCLAGFALIGRPHFTSTNAAESVRQVATLRTARAAHTATTLQSGQVLIVGGMADGGGSIAGVELFDPSGTRFRPAGALLEGRSGHTASDRVHYATTETYNPAKGTFERGPAMANRRYKIAGTSVLLSDGDVLVTSGAQAAELLDIESWTFSEVRGRFPAAYRFSASAPLRGGDVVIAGGYSDANRNTAGVWRFAQAAAN